MNTYANGIAMLFGPNQEEHTTAYALLSIWYLASFCKICSKDEEKTNEKLLNWAKNFSTLSRIIHMCQACSTVADERNSVFVKIYELHRFHKRTVWH